MKFNIFFGFLFLNNRNSFIYLSQEKNDENNNKQYLVVE